MIFTLTTKNHIKQIIFLIILLILFFIEIIFKKIFTKKNKIKESSNNNIINNNEDIPPELFERNIIDKIKDRLKGCLLSINELYFINGLIRKYRPKKIIEIGVCSGGTSAAILAAIQDIEGAMLYSCDLEKVHYIDSKLEVGHIVKNNFSEFQKKWKLFTGNTTAAFIEEIGKDIDFAFIDSAHIMPGEVLNVIEILPFLKKNAIIAFDDINHHAMEHLFKLNFFYPCNQLLMTVLRGKKIIYNLNRNKPFEYTKLGAVILDDNQERYYFDYFYLLSNNWSYMPHSFEIFTIRKIVQKYYDNYYLQMFDKAVLINYKRLKVNNLLNKDYFLYTFPFFEHKRKRPSYE